MNTCIETLVTRRSETLPVDDPSDIRFALKAYRNARTRVVPENVTLDANQCSVLLVDDNCDIRTLIKSFLQDPKIKLTVTNSGREGVQAFKSGRFDLVLMDLEMPDGNGFEATRAIRFWEAQQNLRTTPIAGLTGSSSKAAVSEMFNSGFSHYLPKPISKNVLLQTVGQYFASSGRR